MTPSRASGRRGMTMNVERKRLIEIKDRYAKATPFGGSPSHEERGHSLMGYDINNLESGSRGMFQQEGDAIFCAHAYADIPYLLGLVDALVSAQVAKRE